MLGGVELIRKKGYIGDFGGYSWRERILALESAFNRANGEVGLTAKYPQSQPWIIPLSAPLGTHIIGGVEAAAVPPTSDPPPREGTAEIRYGER